MKPGGLAGAVAGGIAGALVWGAIAKFLNLEVGYVAWGVGLAVGFLSFTLGGRGVTNGVACAVIALASIFGGKVLANKWMATVDMLKEEAEYKSLDDQGKAIAEAYIQNYSWNQAVEDATSDLNVIDILFAVLGIGTAFKLGASPDEAKPAAIGASPLRDVAPPSPEPPASPPPADPEPPKEPPA